jgi:hypothetical protein
MPDRDLSMYTDLIQNGIYPAVSRMFEAMPQLVRPESSQVVDIWYNRYTPGAGQEIHTHSTKYGQQTRYLSGTYILELDEPNGTVFYNVNAAGNPMVSDLLHMSSAKEGDILLFPAHLPHYVKPCIKRRTTIAFNLSLVFPFEAKK